MRCAKARAAAEEVACDAGPPVSSVESHEIPLEQLNLAGIGTGPGQNLICHMDYSKGSSIFRLCFVFDLY